jgi:hypothetical protein
MFTPSSASSSSSSSSLGREQIRSVLKDFFSGRKGWRQAEDISPSFPKYKKIITEILRESHPGIELSSLGEAVIGDAVDRATADFDHRGRRSISSQMDALKEDDRDLVQRILQDETRTYSGRQEELRNVHAPTMCRMSEYTERKRLQVRASAHEPGVVQDMQPLPQAQPEAQTAQQKWEARRALLHVPVQPLVSDPDVDETNYTHAVIRFNNTTTGQELRLSKPQLDMFCASDLILPEEYEARRLEEEQMKTIKVDKGSGNVDELYQKIEAKKQLHIQKREAKEKKDAEKLASDRETIARQVNNAKLYLATELCRSRNLRDCSIINLLEYVILNIRNKFGENHRVRPLDPRPAEG